MQVCQVFNKINLTCSLSASVIDKRVPYTFYAKHAWVIFFLEDRDLIFSLFVNRDLSTGLLHFLSIYRTNSALRSNLLNLRCRFPGVLFISRCFEFWKQCVRSHLGLNRRKLGLQIAICKYPFRNNQPLPPCYLLSSMLRLTTFIRYEIIIICAKCGARALSLTFEKPEVFLWKLIGSVHTDPSGQIFYSLCMISVCSLHLLFALLTGKNYVQHR